MLHSQVTTIGQKQRYVCREVKVHVLNHGSSVELARFRCGWCVFVWSCARLVEPHKPLLKQLLLIFFETFSAFNRRRTVYTAIQVKMFGVSEIMLLLSLLANWTFRLRFLSVQEKSGWLLKSRNHLILMQFCDLGNQKSRSSISCLNN